MQLFISMLHYYEYYFICVDATVSFSHPTYDVNEGNGLVQLILTLTNPSSSVINLQVLNTDGSATGKSIIISL